MSRSKKAGGSVFGLALVAMLVFGAFAASAAQASPVWHYFGKTFKEAGISQQEYVVESEGGVLKISVPEWGLTVNCARSEAFGQLEGESSGTGTFYLNDCSLEGMEEVCGVQPMTIDVSVGLEEGGETGVIMKFTPQGPPARVTTLHFYGEECPLVELPFEIMNGNWESFGGELSTSEGWNVPLTGSSEYAMHGSSGEAGADVWFDGAFVLESVATIGAW